MRNAILTLIGLAALPAMAWAQGEAWADKLFHADKGSTVHDFGTVPRGAQLFYRFPMKNIYAVPLEIINVRASCGCVRSTAPRMRRCASCPCSACTARSRRA